MSVNRSIGFFKGLVDAVKILSNKNNVLIQPVSPIADKKTDYNMLKAIASVKDSYGSSDVFHWVSHKWGDNTKVVGK
jgi:hypothetical protein